MIIRTLAETIGSDRHVEGPGWKSRRLLVASDHMGFALADTLVLDGASLTLEYKHHLEACYCIEGRGDITALSSGATHRLEPFTLYALDQHDRHTVRAIGGDLRLVCVFNPALTGQEIHGKDGSYAPPEVAS